MGTSNCAGTSMTSRSLVNPCELNERTVPIVLGPVAPNTLSRLVSTYCAESPMKFTARSVLSLSTLSTASLVLLKGTITRLGYFLAICAAIKCVVVPIPLIPMLIGRSVGTSAQVLYFLLEITAGAAHCGNSDLNLEMS